MAGLKLLVGVFKVADGSYEVIYTAGMFFIGLRAQFNESTCYTAGLVCVPYGDRIWNGRHVNLKVLFYGHFNLESAHRVM